MPGKPQTAPPIVAGDDLVPQGGRRFETQLRRFSDHVSGGGFFSIDGDWGNAAKGIHGVLFFWGERESGCLCYIEGERRWLVGCCRSIKLTLLSSSRATARLNLFF